MTRTPENNRSEIRFYRSSGPDGHFSNLYRSAFEFEGAVYASAEHAYQVGKTNNAMIANWIREAPYPRLASIVGHGLFPYDVVPKWNEIKVDRMRAVLRAKFTQHPDLRDALLATGKAAIIEESKTDAFWGLGKKGIGLNMLGKLLMELREELRGKCLVGGCK